MTIDPNKYYRHHFSSGECGYDAITKGSILIYIMDEVDIIDIEEVTDSEYKAYQCEREKENLKYYIKSQELIGTDETPKEFTSRVIGELHDLLEGTKC